MIRKHVRSSWILVVLVVALALGMAACKSDNNNEPGDGGTAEPTVFLTATPYAGTIISPDDVLEKDPAVTKRAVLEWGSMFELSGPPQVQGFGKPTSDGVKLAVQEINEAGGFQVGDTIYTIELIEHDTQSNVANTRAVATELVQDDNVKVIFGPATLGETEATLITQRAEVLHLCPCQQREKNALETVDKAHGDSRWAFQTLLPFSLLITQAAKNFNIENPDLHSMALICQDSETARDICERTKQAYEANGIEIVGDVQYFPVGTTDYKPFLTRLQGGNPDYLFNYDDPLSTVEIVKQALQLGIGKLHLVTVPANLVQALIGFEFDVPISAGAAPRQDVLPTTEKAAAYFQRYRDFLGVDQLPPASFVSLMTYDYVYMMAAAMQEAGTVDDTTKISEALETLHYNGVAEDDLFFNSRHLAVHGTEPCTVRYDEPIVCTHNPPPPEAAQ